MRKPGVPEAGVVYCGQIHLRQIKPPVNAKNMDIKPPSAVPHLDQGEYLTRLRYAVQGVHATIDEREAGTADEVAHCARNKYLAR